MDLILRIERLQVEEGFLDGLDLRLIGGLNVLIGARGTGKTSVIELIRFALGVTGYTTESAKRSEEHARSVLGSGQITVTLRIGDRAIIVARSASDAHPRTSAKFVPPIIFSQMEIESVGLHPSGRLRLIDSFLADRMRVSQDEAALASQVRSLTAEIESVTREVTALQEQLSELASIEVSIKELSLKEQEVSKSSAAAATKKQSLDRLTILTSAATVRHDFLERFSTTVDAWIKSLTDLHRLGPDAESWPDPISPDPIGDLRSRFKAAIDRVDTALAEFEAISDAVKSLQRKNSATRIDLNEQARQLRREIDVLQAGAGAIARQGAALRERKAQLQSLGALLADRRLKAATLQDARAKVLDQLEALRQDRFEKRRRIGAQLSKNLGPRIRVNVERAGFFAEYARVIVEALRGSGLRYADIAPQLAENMSPRELLEAAEANNFETVADIVGIGRDRAARVLSHLREKGLGDLATCLVEDEVDLQLLDGQEFKDLTQLSTGQRCTVVLPVVLEHRDRILIVDQPEDHIDNAFIAETLIRAIRNRTDETQMIFSTHNANIPVLGEADLVVQMGSDGRRGFVLMARQLDDPQAVGAITGIMEGGREAFKRRAQFYSRHGT
jgi:prefoldin subunit 5